MNTAHKLRFGIGFTFAVVCLLGRAPAAHAQDLVQTILPASGSLHAWFGHTLAVDGSTLVAGDNQYRPTDTPSCGGAGWGAVDIYKKSAGTWSKTQTFLHTPGSVESMFGKTVSFKGNTFVVSAEREPFINGGTTLAGAGAFFVFRRSSSTANFTQLAKIYAPVPITDDRFTFMGGLATNGTYIAATASPSSSLNIYVYQISGSSVTQVATITPPPGTTGNKLFITDQNVLVVASNGGVTRPLAYKLNGSQVTTIDTSSLSTVLYNTVGAMAGDGNTVALFKRFGSTGAYRLQFVKFTGTGIDWSDERMLPMSYDGLDDALNVHSHQPSIMALEENQGLFVGFPSAITGNAFVLGYKYGGSRYNHAGVLRLDVNHSFPTSTRFAESVAFNGTDMFIGDPGLVTTPGGPNFCTNPGTVGNIRVFQPLATSASGPEGSTKLQPWLNSTPTFMGTAVATDGTYVLGGSWSDADAWGAYGEMTLFQNAGGTWRHVERYLDGWAGGDTYSGWSGFGASVDINDNFIAIGAPYAGNVLDDVRSGAVFIARKVNGTFKTGPLLTTINAIPGTPVGSYFGHAVALAGNTIAIGASDWNNPPNRGSVWLYGYDSSSDSWGSFQALGPNGSSGTDWEAFGAAVDASGDSVIVGIPYRDVGGRQWAGAIQIFRKDASGFYNSVFEGNAPSALPAFSYLGSTVTIGADWAAASGGQGSVVVYRRNTTTGVWSQNAIITPSPAAPGFGYSVAIDGAQLVVGSPSENKVHRYERTGFPATWNRTGTITGPSTSAPTGGFGASVAFRNGTVVIGDHGSLTGAGNADSGAVYVTSFSNL